MEVPSIGELAALVGGGAVIFVVYKVAQWSQPITARAVTLCSFLTPVIICLFAFGTGTKVIWKSDSTEFQILAKIKEELEKATAQISVANQQIIAQIMEEQSSIKAFIASAETAVEREKIFTDFQKIARETQTKIDELAKTNKSLSKLSEHFGVSYGSNLDPASLRPIPAGADRPTWGNSPTATSFKVPVTEVPKVVVSYSWLKSLGKGIDPNKYEIQWSVKDQKFYARPKETPNDEKAPVKLENGPNKN